VTRPFAELGSGLLVVLLVSPSPASGADPSIRLGGVQRRVAF